MLSKAGRAAIAVVAAAGCLMLVAWLDGTVLADAVRNANASFAGPTSFTTLWSLVSLAVAGSILLLAVLVWRTHSAVVGLIYVVVGVFFAFLPDVVWRLATTVNGAPPVLPDPLTRAVSALYAQGVGPLNGIVILGAGMLLIGLAVAGASLVGRGRSGEPGQVPPAAGA